MAPEWASLPTTSDGRADRLQGFVRLFELAPLWVVMGVVLRTLVSYTGA